MKDGYPIDAKAKIKSNGEADLSEIFGSLKPKRKMSGQEFKDLAREGWKDNF